MAKLNNRSDKDRIHNRLVEQQNRIITILLKDIASLSKDYNEVSQKLSKLFELCHYDLDNLSFCIPESMSDIMELYFKLMNEINKHKSRYDVELEKLKQLEED